MNYRHLSVLAFLLALATSTAPAQTAKPHPPLAEAAPESVGMSSERLARIDAVVNDYIASGKQANVGVLIARNGKIVYHKAFGQDDAATKTPLRRDAIFRIASQTKAITSMAAMMLFEEGKFLLDDPVSKYIPAFKTMTVLDKFDPKDSSYTTVPAKGSITIRQLLTHTSGLDYPGIGSKSMTAIYAKNKIPSGIGTPGGTLADAMNRLAKLPLVHQPGEKWTYGLSVDLLGYLVEVVSGQPLDTFFQTRLFAPLGMNDTYFYLPTAKQPRLAHLFTEDTARIARPVPANRGGLADYPKTPNGTYFSGGAGLSSTMSDYAIFLQMLLNKGEYNGKRILGPMTVKLILTNQIGDLNVGQNKFGLGFALTSAKSAARIPTPEGTFDWGGFFGTTYWADPEQGIIGLLYTQKFPNSHGDLTDKFKVLVYQAIVE
jgi:CubicO group peptidase (beta-lactamase class C family)